MPIATFDQYCAMLDNAKRGRFAYPGILGYHLATCETRHYRRLPARLYTGDG